MTALKLAGELYCGPRPRPCRRGRAKPKPKKRRVWGQDSGGRFQTHGQSSVATVRGTRWLTEDTCTGTRVRVARGRGLGQADRASAPCWSARATRSSRAHQR